MRIKEARDPNIATLVTGTDEWQCKHIIIDGLKTEGTTRHYFSHARAGWMEEEISCLHFRVIAV